MPDSTLHTGTLKGRPLDERVTIEMTVEQWGLIAMVLEDAHTATDDATDREEIEEREAIEEVEGIIDMALSQT